MKNRKLLIIIATLSCVLAAFLSGCGKTNVIDKITDNTEDVLPSVADTTVESGEDTESEKAEGTEKTPSVSTPGTETAEQVKPPEDPVVDVKISCVSGTEGAYTLSGTTLTFSGVKADSVYSVSGILDGNIVIDVEDGYKFDLELQGITLSAYNASPITVLSGSEVSLTAKKGTENYIYDKRAAVSADDETQYSAAVYSAVDLEVCGKGSLTVVSDNNNGIRSKDDLQIKNLTLSVTCADNAVKGNDSVEITDAVTTLIAKQGDCIKTENSDLSEKGKQRGTVTISGGVHNLYAACDGIDAAYNVQIENDSTVLNIYTDKYSEYSENVTVADENVYYIRFTSKSYQYSVKYYNSESDYLWVNAEYHSSASGSRYTYYYYYFPKMTEYSKMQFFIYSEDMKQGQDEEYLVASDYLTPNTGYDTFALTSQGSSLRYSWTDYTTKVNDGFGGMGGFGGGRPGGGGPGGMQDGNSDKGEYSTKGIKAANEINIAAGTVNIKAYDDAIHANNDTTLENGASPLGNVNISGGNITVYSNDDGVHADGKLTVSGGSVNVTNSYEGLEGTTVLISGGDVSVLSLDDGVNATTSTGTAVEISGGRLYVYCNGDGIDSNSRSSYTGIVFSGGNAVVISTSGGNSAIDSEQGYAYNGGSVIAIMPSGGMTNEATHCLNFNSVATSKTLSASEGSCVTVNVGGKDVAVVKMPKSISGRIIYLGSSSASVTSSGSSSAELDANGVWWAN